MATVVAVKRFVLILNEEPLFVVLCYSDLCTEQLISLRSLEVERYISAVRYTNMNGIVFGVDEGATKEYKD